MDWFVSKSAAFMLSILALMTFVGRSFLDARYVLTEDMPDASNAMVAAWALFTMAIVGGWVWALMAGAQDSRSGLIAAFALALLIGLLGGAGSLVAFRPIMPSAKPLGEIALWSNLVTGILASISIGFRLWG